MPHTFSLICRRNLKSFDYRSYRFVIEVCVKCAWERVCLDGLSFYCAEQVKKKSEAQNLASHFTTYKFNIIDQRQVYAWIGFIVFTLRLFQTFKIFSLESLLEIARFARTTPDSHGCLRYRREQKKGNRIASKRFHMGMAVDCVTYNLMFQCIDCDWRPIKITKLLGTRSTLNGQQRRKTKAKKNQQNWGKRTSNENPYLWVYGYECIRHIHRLFCINERTIERNNKNKNQSKSIHILLILLHVSHTLSNDRNFASLPATYLFAYFAIIKACNCRIYEWP